jgi:hypothetical protein
MRTIITHDDPSITVSAADRDTYVLKRSVGSEMGIVTMRFGDADLTDEALLAIVADRLVNAQICPKAQPSREQGMALFCVQQAMLWLSHHRADQMSTASKDS